VWFAITYFLGVDKGKKIEHVTTSYLAQKHVVKDHSSIHKDIKFHLAKKTHDSKKENASTCHTLYCPFFS
jgi:hypothetical protein